MDLWNMTESDNGDNFYNTMLSNQMLSPSPFYVLESITHFLPEDSPVLLNNILTCMFLENSVLLIFIHFIHQWFYSPLLGPRLFFSFLIFFTQTVGLLGRVISPSQGR
jgi:hypothetical protein